MQEKNTCLLTIFLASSWFVLTEKNQVTQSMGKIRTATATAPGPTLPASLEHPVCGHHFPEGQSEAQAKVPQL